MGGFGGVYYYGERGDGTYTETPHKDGIVDHVCDALRYGLINLVLKGYSGQFFPGTAEGLKRIKV